MSADPIVNLYEAKTQLSALVERAANGEEIVIAKAGRPLARLVAFEPAPALKFGSLKGKIEVPEDFDDIAAEEIDHMFNAPGR
ncbi:type II toxin-antitoxin system prevent-host-death family antitoxin [Burkholderiaceae bacterium FT117]|nr:type II toxin-antitoxin system prevent-host-death family antitoxin [Zeimonas sediminis]MCM5572067.1 type II toxin-antitoxin system prevent-host-death family antitoxin [Zeimonas sediminis]